MQQSGFFAPPQNARSLPKVRPSEEQCWQRATITRLHEMAKQLHKQTSSPHVLAGEDEIVFTLDLTGNFNFINAAGERASGYSCEEARRLNVLNLLPDKSAAEIRSIARSSIRQRFGNVFEIEIATRDRQRLRLETSLDVVRRADGALEFRGIAFAQRDDLRRPIVRPRCLDKSFGYSTFRRRIRTLRTR
jgi:PAS domain S-box-containing protein